MRLRAPVVLFGCPAGRFQTLGRSAVAVLLAAFGVLLAARPAAAAVTFPVCDVARATTPYVPVDGQDALARVVGKFEASSHADRPLVVTHANPLLAAAQHSFSRHYPFVLTPDAIWLAICQGFALHVDQNAETLRYRVVAHGGKKTIRIRRDDFLKGSSDTRWPEVFPAFCDSIRNYLVTDLHAVLLPTFTTTSPVETIAFEIAFMDAFDSYFEYSVVMSCGVPEVTLDGTAEDWRQVREHARRLREFDLQWWIDPLMPVLDQFVAAAEGQPDREFWKGIYSRMGISGEPRVSGWVLRFFPYVLDETGKAKRNPFLDHDPGPGEGIGLNDFPTGMSRVDFKFVDGRSIPVRVYAMEMLAGFIGIRQDPTTLALQPEIGWVVRDDPEEK